MEGRGRILGFVMQELRPGAEHTETARLYSFQANGCATESCSSSHDPIERGIGRTDEVLPAGTYRIDLLADGEQARYIFRFPGLTGRRTLKPSLPSEASLATGVQSIYSNSEANIYSGGEYFKPASLNGGIAFLAMWLVSDSPPVAWEACRKASSNFAPDPPPEFAFYPGCNASQDSFVQQQAEGGRFSFTLTDRSFPRGLGGWFIGNETPQEHGLVVAWIPYGD